MIAAGPELRPESTTTAWQVREPLSRIESDYNYIVRSTNHPQHRKMNNMTLSEYLSVYDETRQVRTCRRSIDTLVDPSARGAARQL